MNGVEILSSEIIYNGILPGWAGCLGFMLIIAGVIVAAFGGSENDLTFVSVGVIGVVIGLILFVLALSSSTTDINYIEYKVTIDDSVSMNEFLDKYEILDQEGKIYTVKERE
jgi:hypothetical protein